MTETKFKGKNDAYGKAVFDFYKDGEGFEIVERDDGYFDLSKGPPFYFSKYKKWPHHEKEAIKYVKGRVLDVGCGAGRHAIYLQKKGHDVVGIDNSLLAIKVCKLRGLKKARVMSITEVNKFKQNSFDTIIMMGNNFGLFGNFKRAKKLLKKFHKITSNNALIIAESRDPYKTKRLEHLEYQRFCRKNGRTGGQIRMRIRYKKYVTPWFDYLLVSKKEMENILKNTGWKIKKTIKFNLDSSIYIAIIEKVK